MMQNLSKFRNFYDQMDFSPEQRLANTKAIIKLIDTLGAQTSLSKTIEEVVSLRAPAWPSLRVTCKAYQISRTDLCM